MVTYFEGTASQAPSMVTPQTLLVFGRPCHGHFSCFLQLVQCILKVDVVSSFIKSLDAWRAVVDVGWAWSASSIGHKGALLPTCPQLVNLLDEAVKDAGF